MHPIRSEQFLWTEEKDWFLETQVLSLHLAWMAN